MVLYIILFIAGYLLGSIPSGVWIGKTFYKTDIREQGSGSSGTTNTFRVLGSKAGIIVLLMDILKGTIATWLPIIFNTNIHPIWFGLAAIIGHVYPLFAKFKGGKAVATAAGIGFALYPLYLLVIFFIWISVLYLSSMVSLASIIGVFFAFILSFFLNDMIFTIVIGLVFLIVLYRHISNIKRIKNGTENKVSWGRRKDK